MKKEKALHAVEVAIDKAFDKGKESAMCDVSNLLQWVYNYVNKQKYSDEKTRLIKELKDFACRKII